MPKKAAPPNQAKSHTPSHDFPLVSAQWLIRAFLAAMLVAAAATYLALCFLFYQGQWQIIFHPSASITATPASLGIPYDEVRFDFTETGQPQLDAWWIPAEPHSPTSKQTILYLHGATGNLTDSLPALKTLHTLGTNIFAIDYRGYGQSMPTHPSEQHVYQDADAALAYLAEVRHIPPASIVVYGQGLGATIAAELARRHPQVAGLILDDPAPPALTLINRDPRTKLLPVQLLFRDRFDLAHKLKTLKLPKLFLETAATNYFGAAANPKTLAAPSLDSNRAALPQVAAFLHQVQSPATIQTTK